MKTVSIILVTLLCTIASVYGQVAVIVNKSITEESVDAGTLGKMYNFKEKKWNNGDKVVLFVLKENDAVRDKFYEFIGESHTQLRNTWMKVQLTGGGKAPEALKTEAEMLQKVSSTPGAIGFVSADKVDDSVKVIAKIE